MTAIAAWCLKNWRLIAYAVAAVAVLWMLALIRHWHEDSTVALPEARRTLAAEVACAAGSKCAERVAALKERQQAVSEQVIRGYQDEIEALRARPIPVRTVRLCPDARAARVPGAEPARTADAAGPAAGIVSGAAGPDIGPDLYQLARDADEVAARLRALQQWSAALATPAAPQP